MVVTDFATIIACGGHGTRIGGDKPHRMFNGRPLIDHAIEYAQAMGGPVALAGQPSGDVFQRSLPCLYDDVTDLGPISALRSGFAFAHDQGLSHILLVGCDQPFLPAGLAKRLAHHIGDAGAAIPEYEGQPQFMAGLWRVDQAGVESYIADSGRSLWQFSEGVDRILVPWDRSETPNPFTDINDLDALERAQSGLQSKR